MSTAADELARAFDADFARAPAVRAPDSEDLLAIRVAGEPYALVRGELAGLFVDKPVTALPGAAPGLLGISGFRGALVAVYDLPSLIGGAVGGAVGGAPLRWLVTAAAAPVALAFDGFDAFLRVPRAAIAGHTAGGHVRRAVRRDGELRPILDLASIVDAIRARARRDP